MVYHWRKSPQTGSRRPRQGGERTRESSTSPETHTANCATTLPRTPIGIRHDHASASRVRLRDSYGTIEWMMITESCLAIMTLGVRILSQPLSIMP